MSAGRGKHDQSHQDLRATTAERLEAIVQAAERAAESVIDDAEAQARRHLAEAKAEAERMTEARAGELGDLVDSLLSQANTLREQAERLQAALEDAQARVNPEARREPARPERRRDHSEQAEVLTLRTPPADQEPPPPEEDDRSSRASGARLLATQMAVSGSSREEIAERLRSGFEIEDSGAILDAILGPED